MFQDWISGNTNREQSKSLQQTLLIKSELIELCQLNYVLLILVRQHSGELGPGLG